MQLSTLQSSDSLFSALGRWWQNWKDSRAHIAELGNFTPKELHDIARDAGATTQELRALAGKWPDSADLLTRRMAALGLNTAELARTQPATSNDLKKLCSLCASKRPCEHDLVKDAANPAWNEYCPNATTLTALRDQQPGPEAPQS